jgi:hypothetical protein
MRRMAVWRIAALLCAVSGAAWAQGLDLGPSSGGGCPISGCTFTGPIDSPLGYLVGGVVTLGPVPGGSGLTTNSSTDYATTGGNTRYNMHSATLSPSVNTTNIWENDNSFVTLNGPGQATGEINVKHAYFQVNLGAFSNQTETFESSMLNSGTIVNFYNNVALIHNTSTGTATALTGFESQLTNDNTTPGSIATWIPLLCNPMVGAGAAPTLNYCLANKDPNAAIVTLGRVAIGSIGVPPAAQIFVVQGPDNAAGTFPIIAKNLAGTNVFFVTDAGGASISNSLTLGTAGTTVGTLLFANATSGTIKLAPTTGALGNVTLTFPDVTDTVAVLGTNQTHTATQTFSGTANFSGVLQGNGVAGVSCAANSVTVLTEVVTNGIITHC